MDNALRSILGEGMVWIRAGINRIEPRVNIVPRGRAHRRRLKATLELHALGRQVVDIGSVSLPAITAEIAMRHVIGDNEDEIGLRLGERTQSDEQKGKQYGFHLDLSFIMRRHVKIVQATLQHIRK